MDLDIKTRSATFVSPVEGTPDTEVRVLHGPDHGIDFAVSFGSSRLDGHVPDRHRLQGAEALQFVADQIGGTVEGRLSPFVRGWLSTAHDAHHRDLEKVEAEEMYAALKEFVVTDPPAALPGFTDVEAEVARMVVAVMNFSHANGLRVAQAVEAMMK
jgi:hypothetical protein